MKYVILRFKTCPIKCVVVDALAYSSLIHSAYLSLLGPTIARVPSDLPSCYIVSGAEVREQVDSSFTEHSIGALRSFTSGVNFIV
jgi:hypothetical protein